MDAAIKAELDKLTELIINSIPVEQIYLFGSYAYGKPQMKILRNGTKPLKKAWKK